MREIQRSCPVLYETHLATRLASHANYPPNVAVNFVALKAPWSTSAQLKKHLLSDPTSKSREKFVGIIQSLFSNAAFSNAESSLTATFQRVVTKVAHEFKGTTQSASKRTGDLLCVPPSVSFASPKRVLPRKRRASTTKHEEEEDEDDEDDEDSEDAEENEAVPTGAISKHDENAGYVVEPNGPPHVADGTVIDPPPPRKLRYVTRSSTDGYRTGVATVNGTTYHCKYVVDRRCVQRTNPLLRVGMHLTTNATAPPTNTDSESSTECAHECHFDPSLFDDHDQAQHESELDSWDFLDDWAWQQSAGPAVRAFTSLNTSRPVHPLPLLGGGLTLLGQPLVHVSQSDLSEFRSIAHPAGESVLDTGASPAPHRSPSPALSDGPCSPVTVDSLPRTSFHFSPFARETDFTRLFSTQGASVPFPDPSTPSIYSRRVAFYRPVTPDDPFRGVDGSSDDGHTTTASAPVSRHVRDVSTLNTQLSAVVQDAEPTAPLSLDASDGVNIQAVRSLSASVPADLSHPAVVDSTGTIETIERPVLLGVQPICQHHAQLTPEMVNAQPL